MIITRSYIVNHTEYLVLDGSHGYMPGQEGIRLLAHRREGIGADRVIVFTGSEREPSFQLFDDAGMMMPAAKQDYIALVCYLREQNLAANAGEIGRHLGAQVWEVSLVEVPHFEAHVTEHFLGRMKEADRQAEATAC